MRMNIFSLVLLLSFGCSQDDGQAGAGTTVDDTGTEPQDTGSGVPDWVDPQVPTDPIPPTEGTGTTPEDSDFDWSDIGEEQIGNLLPQDSFNWDDHPQYGTAQLLSWSDSDECVCFDIDCAPCSQEPCSAESCT